MRKLLQLAAIAGCLLAGTPGQAMPPSGREVDGLIRSVDAPAQTVTVQIAPDSLRRFEWNRRTEFFRGGKSVEMSVLRPGEVARFRYHSPFFGQPFRSKVVVRVQGERRRSKQHARRNS